MRPALAALAEQQKQIEAMKAGIWAIAELAGIGQDPRLAALRPRLADEDNPAQPVPQPAAETPYQTTEEALAPDGRDDVESIGASPVDDVSPDATTNLLDSIASRVIAETVLDEPLDLNEQDVTAPVAGTEGPRPLEEVKIETDVRIDQDKANNPETMWPLDEGPFSEQVKTTGGKEAGEYQPTKEMVCGACGHEWKTRGQFQSAWKCPNCGSEANVRQKVSTRAGARTYAALHLARLMIQAGITGEDDLTLGSMIDADPSMSDAKIADRIEILTQTQKATARRQPAAPRNLVPRTAGHQRQTPSMQGEPQVPIQMVASGVGAEEMLFE